MWTLAFGQHEDRTLTHGYKATREDAMAAFATSWRRGVKTGKEERTPGDLPSLRLWLTLIRRSLRALQFEGQLQPHCLVRFRSTGARAGVSSASARASSRCRINWPRLSA